MPRVSWAAVTAGNKVNTTSAVTSTNGGTGNTATASVLVIPRPDLTITKTHVGNFVAGQTGVYTLTVSNIRTGPTFVAVNVVDPFPPGFTTPAITETAPAADTSPLATTQGTI